MNAFWDSLTNLFSFSNKVQTESMFSLRSKIINWTNSRVYPAYYELPAGISFSPEFWNRVNEIYRHTQSDGHERAVSVFWADDDFVLTESVRGDTSQVNIPGQTVQVAYKKTGSQQFAEKVVSVNGTVYSSKSVEWRSVPRDKKIEVLFLFNMHTHPPHNAMSGSNSTSLYSYFSLTDINSFLQSNAVLTGMISDKLWLLAKTNETKLTSARMQESDISPETLRSQLGFKVYSGLFGKSVIAEAK